MNLVEMMIRINVNKPYLPSKSNYVKYLDQIWSNCHLTNFGPLSTLLQDRLCEYLGVDHLLFVSNGTLALQIAYKVLGIEGNVITTPFSFVATTSTLIWEHLNPIFCDIDQHTLCIDTSKIESMITGSVNAILPVHTFGNICDVEVIEDIVRKNNLRLIYDAAHAFGVNYKGKSALLWGDISTISFHATKIFHTIEGGALVFRKLEHLEYAKDIINFGLKNNIPSILGINAKNSEFHAAMGLCILDDIDYILEVREDIWSYYFIHLKDYFIMQDMNEFASRNYHYFPIIFDNNTQLLNAINLLEANNIFPRRYFYPSLDELAYVSHDSQCSISNSISSRILCLPLYVGLDRQSQDIIINTLIKSLNKGA